MKSENLNSQEPSGPLQACNGAALPLPFTIKKIKKSSLINYFNFFGKIFLKFLKYQIS
jgi:hypothetical protein